MRTISQKITDGDCIMEIQKRTEEKEVWLLDEGGEVVFSFENKADIIRFAELLIHMLELANEDEDV